jgi:hypothetical protein
MFFLFAAFAVEILALVSCVHLATQIVEIFHSHRLFMNGRLSIHQFLFYTV